MIRLKTLLQYNYFYIILVILVLCLTFIRNSFYNESKFNGSETSFVGIVDDIKKSDDYYKITIKSKEKIIGSYYSKEPINISLGDKITFKGTLSKPKNNTIPNTFKYRKYLYNHHVYYLVKIDNIKVISKTRSVKYKAKNYIVKRSEKFKHSDYFKAFLIGDKSEMDDYSIFQKNGVSHIFAISGMHLSLLSGIVLFVFKKSRFKEILACIFLILFSMITNYSASIYRSLLLFIYIVLNKKLDLRISTANVLLLVVCTLLIFNPLIIYDMGFLYSVSVSLGLILFNKYMKKNYFVNMFLTSFIAFLFSLPITLYYNYEINLMQIINNVIIVPLVSIIIYPLTILTFIFSFLEPILNVLISILKFISPHLIMINIIVPKVSLIFYFTYYVFLFMFLKTNRKIFILLIIIYTLCIKAKPLIDFNTYVYFLDVGQGDSSLIYSKHKVILIDTGGNDNIKVSDNTIKFLKSTGKSKINYLVLTHGDYDHMGEAINLVNNFKVEKVIFNCGPYNELESGLIKVLDKKKIPYYSCIKELNINDNKLYFLNNKNYGNENDNSSVIYTKLNNHKFLFMGDAGVEVEEDLIEKYNLQDIDVLKVGHHGSKTSSSKKFIDEIEPKYSIISVGKNNRYRHPNNEVLNNIKDSKIYRTDLDGSIMFKIKNDKFKIETCSP
ncbi:MAG: DNA internalization-related competence protein ComEC/Rec2 [Bacilli bacterium]|nr:DNA internalization-related competence protein ComEC/Rec2 [Bacilli bacterium]